MPVGSDLQRLRNELETARLQIDAALGALDAWEAGAMDPNREIIIRELDGAERTIRRAQHLVLRLIDRGMRGLRQGLDVSLNRRILERWRDRSAREQGS